MLRFDNTNMLERIKLLDSKYLIDRIGEQIDDVIALRNYAGDWHKVYDIKNRIDLSNLFSYNYNYLKTKHSQFILRDII